MVTNFILEYLYHTINLIISQILSYSNIEKPITSIHNKKKSIYLCVIFQILFEHIALYFFSVFSYVKIALLPAIPTVQSMFATKHLKDLKKAIFGDSFNICIPANKIFTKTLQINVWNQLDDREKCVVSIEKFYSIWQSLVLSK